MRFDHLAGRIVNANRGIVPTAVVDRVADCVIRRAVPQPTEWQRIGNQIDAAMIFAGADFYSRALQKNVAKQFGPV